MHDLFNDFHSLLETYGLWALFVCLTLETLGLPVPGESAMTATAALAGDGQFKFWHVAVTAWCAALLGDNTSYLLGRRLGHPAIATYGGKVGITEEQLDRAERLMDKYGFLVVMSARFLPLLRQLNGLVAGSTDMRWHIFVVADMIGSAAWVAFWGTIGYQVGHIPDLVPDILKHLKALSHYIIPAILAVLLILTIARLITWRRSGKPKS